MRPKAAILALCLTFSAGAADAKVLLKYSIEGLSGSTLDNAQAYLGELPESEAERANFVYSARRQVGLSLNALGYYYPRIEIAVNREREPWRMLIKVDPGESVRLASVNVTLDGEAGQDPAFEELLEDIPLQPDQRLNHGSYEAFKTRIQSLGQQRGYLEGSMKRNRVTVDAAAGTAAVDLHYDSGPRYHFGELSIEEFPLDQRQFDNMAIFARGDHFDMGAIQEYQAQLQRTGYFGTALVRPGIPDRDAREVPMRVELTPNVRHSYRVGLGFSTDTQERISLTWRTPLINRFGHRQETRLEYSPVRPRGNFTYIIPLSHPTDDILQVRARLESNEYGDLESTQRGSTVGREWRLGDWVSTVHLRYLDELWDLGDDSKQSAYWLPGATLSHRSTRGDPLDPVGGFSQVYAVEAGTAVAGSDIDLVRMTANWRFAFTPRDRHRLVTRLDAGAVLFEEDKRPDLAPSLSFFAGGSHSIRGYSYQSLGPEEDVPVASGETVKLVVGGDRLLVGSLEYQYYIRPEWRAALFIDAGNAFNGSDFDPVVGTGLGAHLISPVGPIRLDLGYAVNEAPGWRIHLTIGAEL